MSTTSPCTRCDARCCRYFALEIDAPEDRADFENLRWYLAHERTILYVLEGKWYLHVENPCRHLQSDNRCGNYANRPAICREHTVDECEFSNSWGYELKFTAPEELELYLNARFPARGRRQPNTRPARRTCS